MANGLLRPSILILLLPACSSTSPSPDSGQVEVDASPGVPDWRVDQSKPDTTSPPPIWGKCNDNGWFEGYYPPPATVQCTTLSVPLDASKPGGPTFDLRVARDKAKAPQGTPKVIVHVAGGPGVSSIAMSGPLPHYLPRLADGFDHLYVDLRGTGFSDALTCPAGSPDSKATWEACAASVGNRDLDNYLTLDAANDLEVVRQRLGYNKLILDGGSYGTRVVLEYMRQHPERLSLAVMESMAPPDWGFFSWMVKAVDQTVAGLVGRCNKDPACKAVCPDLAADLAARRQALKSKPHPIKVNGIPTFEDDVTFALLLGAALDDPSTYFRIPRAIHAALAGDNTLWNSILGDVVGGTVTEVSNLPKAGPPAKRWRPARRWALGPALLADGLHATVVCAEWLPNEKGISELQQLLGQQSWADPAVNDLAEACAAWKVSPIPASLRAPVTASTKALLISGELDMRTPASVGEHTAATLANATHLVVPNAGHADGMITNPCVTQIMTDFILADGDMKAVSTSCLASLKQPAW